MLKYLIVNENYKIISKAKLYSTKDLTSKSMSEGFILYKKVCI
jgi:hypothetical protein